MTLLQQPAAETLGWALWHSLWQGSLIALVLLLALRVVSLRHADLRYGLACAALAAMLLAPLATFAWLSRPPAGAPIPLTPESHAPALFYPAGSSAPEVATASLWRGATGLRQSRALEPFLPWLALLWLVGSCALSLRLVGGLIVTRRLKRRNVTPAPPHLQAALGALCRRLGVDEHVRLLLSSHVPVPMVVGWLRPAVLLPISAVTGLTVSQLETILAHELAHIKRRDHLVNLLQNLAETLLFYHPAVWWVSGAIRREREHCCDDLVVALAEDRRLIYATALARLETLRRRQPTLALSAHGGLLMNRIRRIAREPTQGTSPWTLAVLFAALAVLGALVLTPGAAQVQPETPYDYETEARAAGARRVGAPDSASPVVVPPIPRRDLHGAQPEASRPFVGVGDHESEIIVRIVREATMVIALGNAVVWPPQEPVTFKASYDDVYDNVLRGLSAADALAAIPAERTAAQGQFRFALSTSRFRLTDGDREAGTIAGTLDGTELRFTVQAMGDERTTLEYAVVAGGVPDPVYLQRLLSWLEARLERVEP